MLSCRIFSAVGACKIDCVSGKNRLKSPATGGTDATTDELLDTLMKDYKKPEDLIGESDF